MSDDWQFQKPVCPSDCSFISSWEAQAMLGHLPPCVGHRGPGSTGGICRDAGGSRLKVETV